jgi:hypothetical protein
VGPSSHCTICWTRPGSSIHGGFKSRVSSSFKVQIQSSSLMLTCGGTRAALQQLRGRRTKAKRTTDQADAEEEIAQIANSALTRCTVLKAQSQCIKQHH